MCLSFPYPVLASSYYPSAWREDPGCHPSLSFIPWWKPFTRWRYCTRSVSYSKIALIMEFGIHARPATSTLRANYRPTLPYHKMDPGISLLYLFVHAAWVLWPRNLTFLFRRLSREWLFSCTGKWFAENNTMGPGVISSLYPEEWIEDESSFCSPRSVLHTSISEY